MRGDGDSQFWSHPRWSEKMIVTLALSVACCWVFWTGVTWFRYHPHLPWRDLFLVLGQLQEWAEAPFSLGQVWQWFEPHYGAHRIAVARLLLWLDHRLLAGQNHLFYAAGWSSLVLLVAVYSRAAANHFKDRCATLMLLALALTWLFSPAHVWNLLNPINISWHISLACSLCAFYLLLGKTRALRLSDWTLAYCLCALAAAATFGGVIAWLLLPLLACQVQPRAFAPTLLCSAGLAWAYAGTMSSDAAMAANWDLGSPEVVEHIRSQARAALAAHTPWAIIVKTVTFFGWPLATTRPALGAACSIASVLVLAGFFLQSLRLRLRAGTRANAWFEFCILAAGLCLGIALATQLGRVMAHPNHLHGPSFERYQTIVVVYWLAISGLLLGLRPRVGAAGGVLFALLLLLNCILAAPTGTYLQQEMQSAEAAGRLFARGQRAQPGQAALVAGNRFTPEFVFSFDEYFKRNQLSYRAPVAPPAATTSLARCPAARVTAESVSRAGGNTLILTASLPAPATWFSRDILVYQASSLVGLLTPVHSGDYAPLSLLDPRRTRWQGELSEADPGHEFSGAQRALVLVVRDLLGVTPWCAVQLAAAQ